MVYPGFFGKALAMLEKYPKAAFTCGECEIVNEIGAVLAFAHRPDQHSRPPIYHLTLYHSFCDGSTIGHPQAPQFCGAI